jgi:hypothetical protein
MKKPRDRAARWADCIRNKMGGKAGTPNGAEPQKRNRKIHQASFDSFCWEHDCSVNRSFAGFAEQFRFYLQDVHWDDVIII